MKHSPDTILEQLKQAECRLEKLLAKTNRCAVIDELESRVNWLKHNLSLRAPTEPDGHLEHDLGIAPTKTNMQRFQLNRCEALFDQLEYKLQKLTPNNIQELLYPAGYLSLYQNVLKLIFKIKFLLFKIRIDYDAFPFWQLLHIRFSYQVAQQLERIFCKLRFR